MVMLARERRGLSLIQDGGVRTDKTFEDLSCFIALLTETCCSEESHSEKDPSGEVLLVTR